MDIPNLPTDNLYKFLALSGLALFIFTLYLQLKNSSELFKEIDQIKIEVKLLDQDSILLNHRIEEIKEKQYILLEYFVEKYTDLKIYIDPKIYPDLVKSISNNKPKSDSILTYNAIYSMALRDPELQPLYVEYKSMYEDNLNWTIEYSKKMIEKDEQLKLLKGKGIRLKIYSIIYGLFGLLGLYISYKGFLNWYLKIQIYQDEALKNSALSNIKSLKTDTQDKLDKTKNGIS